MAISNAQQKRIDALAEKLQPTVRKAFLDAMARHATSIDVDALIEALEYAGVTGNYSRVENILRINQAVTFTLTEAVRSLFIAGAQTVGPNLPLSLRATFGFGGNPRAMADVDRITGDLITNIEAQNRETITTLTRDLVKRAVDTGIPVKRAALEIVGTINRATGLREGGYLGLDVPRAEQAARVAAMLRDPEAIKGYFIEDRETGKLKPRYTTTDRRYDARIRKAIKEGRALTASEAEPITKAHRSRLLKNRADTISRNETLNALRAGERAGFQQLVDSGAVQDAQIIREWLPTKDARTRQDHVAMTGQTVRGMNVPFTFPDGHQAMFPGDVSMGAGPEDTVMCRCAVSYTLARKKVT